MYDKYHYCYMRSILTDINNKTKGFCLILCDNKFNNVGILNTDVEGLNKIAADDRLIKDFSIESNYLKCDNVSRMPITNEDLKTFGNIIDCTSEEKTFLDFLYYGCQNDFLVVSNNIKDNVNYTGTAFTSFRNIEFSQSTMTVFARIVEDNTIYNQMIIVMNNQNLEIVNFTFAIPVNTELPPWVHCNYVKELHNCYLNNREYVLYEMQGMPVYITSMLKSSALINKAATLRVKYKNIIEALKEFKSTLHVMSSFQITDTQLEWTGGSNSYKSAYGVYLKSSWPLFKKSSIDKCIDWYTELLQQYSDNPDKITAIIKSESINEMTCLILLTIHQIMMSDSDITQVLINCENTINDLQCMRLDCDIYLYKMRVFAYFKGTRLTPANNPVLQGSDENAYTVVEHKLSYGME